MQIRLNTLFSFTVLVSLFVSISLLIVRIFLTGVEGYQFLLWNLFLAWVPYGISVIHERSARKWMSGILFISWFFFFPNAPYIVTDFVHLPWKYFGMGTFWYDGVLIGMFSFTGLLFGLGSLFRIHRSLTKQVGQMVARVIVAIVIILSGVGMYLGRFLRWNSWDVALRPMDILRNAIGHYSDPLWFEHAVIFSMVFSLFIAISYMIFFGMYRLLSSKNLTDTLIVDFNQKKLKVVTIPKKKIV